MFAFIVLDLFFMYTKSA